MSINVRFAVALYCQLFLFTLVLFATNADRLFAVDTASSMDTGSEAIVELFDAIDERLIEVRFVPQDATTANVLVKNLTKDTVRIDLPDRFGAVHVLGQVGLGAPAGGLAGRLGGGGAAGGGIAGGAGLNAGGVGQGLGGGFGGGQFGGGQFGGGQFGGGQFGGGQFGGGQNGGAGLVGGRGFFRIEPGKVKKLTVQTVCLEHGKQDPNPKMKYALVRLESLVEDERIYQLCSELAQGNVSQQAAQAAAWHLANDLTWDDLAAKNRVESRYTGNERFFTDDELRSAFLLVQEMTKVTPYETR